MTSSLENEIGKLTAEEKLKLATELLDEVYGDFDNSPSGEAVEELMTARLKEFDQGETSARSFADFRNTRLVA